MGAIVGQAQGDIVVENCHTGANVTLKSNGRNGGSYLGGIVGSAEGTTSISIKNCSNKATVIGAGSYVGGIVGVSKGDIQSCYNTGSITGSYVGGITGINYYGVLVNNCYNKGAVSGKINVGGIVGGEHALAKGLVIQNSYNTGAITGKNSGSIVNPVSSGTVTNCYKQEDGITTSKLGSGFVDDTANKNGGYPVFQWQKDANWY